MSNNIFDIIFDSLKWPQMHGWLILFIGWFMCVIAGGFAGSGKSAAWLGAILGGILGPLGVVAALGLDQRYQCPHCTGKIDGVGEKCQYCKLPLHWDADTDGPQPTTSKRDDENEQVP
jgi:hypothetical protein